MSTAHLLNAVSAGNHRLTPAECLELYHHAELLELAKAASAVRDRLFPGNTITFVIDRNINYTNICTCRCKFCAFYRDQESPEAYLLSWEEVHNKIQEAIEMGATQIMLQGGLNPDLSVEYYEDLFQKIRAAFPGIVNHSLSAPEIQHIASISGLSTRQVLARMKSAGLASLPGGGAEVLDDGVRSVISPEKISTANWLRIMEEAHETGLNSTATMMLGTIDTAENRIAHMERIRALQDRTGGFRGFIMWTYQPGNNELMGKKISSAEYLRMLALGRLFMDNVEHIQGSWLTQGREIGQLSILFGADDLGSTMLEENVVRAAGLAHKMTVDTLVSLVSETGKTAAERNTAYQILRRYDTVTV